MGGFILGVVIALLINCLTAVFSRKHALQLVPWLLLYCGLHGGFLLLGTDVVWGEAMNLAQKYHSRWSYVVVLLTFAVCGLVFWTLIQVATRRLDMQTTASTTASAKAAGADATAPELPKFLSPEQPKVEHHSSPPPKTAFAPPITSGAKPEISAYFVQATSPGVVVTNRGDLVVRDPTSSVVMWNLSRNPPVSIPVANDSNPGQFIKKNNGLLLATLDRPTTKPYLTSGDKIFGFVSVDCPECESVRQYWLSFTYGKPEGSWFAEVPIHRTIDLLMVSTWLNESNWDVDFFMTKVPHGNIEAVRSAKPE